MNPFRYRGYFYDEETGWYYVSSRYYDPEVGRWLNADSQLNDSDGLLGYNMFAYCNNNPVMYADSSGHLPFLVITAAVGAAVGAVVGGIRAATAGNVVWKAASFNFANVASNSRGAIYSIQNGLGIRVQSIWATIEYPLLKGKDIVYGVVSQNGTIQIMP